MTNSIIRPWRASAAVLAVLVVTAVAACGDDGASSADRPTTTVTTTSAVAEIRLRRFEPLRRSAIGPHQKLTTGSYTPGLSR